MFQVEPIIWLQSFESPAMDWLMSTVSLLGYTFVYSGLMLFLIFGFRLKQSLSVLVAAFIVGLLSHGLKNSIKFPRPSDIDVRVLEPGQEPALQLLENGSGESFWDFPSPKALEAARIQPEWSYGLPSGHVSAATAFLLGMALFFRSKGLLIFSTVWIPLMALSRMYLGRHFLADVLGGLVVGIGAVMIAYWLLRPLNRERSKPLNYRALMRLTCFAVPIAILAPFVDLIDTESAGRLMGLVILYFYIVKVGLPSDAGTFWQRMLRILIAIVLYVAIDRSINLVMESLGWEDLPLAIMIGTFVSGMGTFVGTMAICRHFKLYVFPMEKSA